MVVDDRIWGVLLATTIDGRRLPSDTEQRLGQFVELMAAALANAQARAELLRLADEQAALREVAELIARTAPTEAVFAGDRCQRIPSARRRSDDLDQIRG